MTRIENDHGTFEAETEAEALKLARKAQRAAKKAEKAREEAHRMARLYAFEAGFCVHDRMAEVRLGEQEKLPRAWRWKAPGQSYCPVSVLPDERSALDGHVAAYQMVGGSVRVEHHGYRVDGVLVNGAGYPMAVQLRNTTSPNRIYLSAVGESDGELVFVELSVLCDELRGMLAGREV